MQRAALVLHGTRLNRQRHNTALFKQLVHTGAVSTSSSGVVPITSPTTSSTAISSTKRHISSTLPRSAMAPGTPIPGLDFFKKQAQPVALERSEYPPWVNDLAKPLPSIVQLRRMDETDATTWEKNRFLKLEKRLIIKRNNLNAESK
mmetsp:Transcript_16439/g.20539  ORF Transcript_16439/g.20539 Transcript_16439/m.20539 type:complete len:147 (+) Transcript_16439:104-544(+)|eukprot:CAMPEP_0172500544 /NCGR_PEP_ID=MMETSP1066-20121228/139876_1 /TAXON_ID=671091 /ORGANISM="Coscinodiscus wailesii, Strain CCMP2513" /LENGTH=146 /DNA_ID=CAMNT_0013274831 /DNA_START=104 /DNA_END=544 /DNA_ORIENTATION=-